MAAMIKLRSCGKLVAHRIQKGHEKEKVETCDRCQERLFNMKLNVADVANAAAQHGIRWKSRPI